jgi:gliding motility-associated-like protein
LITKTNILSLIISLVTVLGYGQSLPFACATSRAMYGVTGYENSVFDWEVEGGTIIGDMNDTIIVEWNYNRGTHRLQVVEITEHGCIGDPVEAYVEIRAPDVDIGDEIEICERDTFTFNAETDYSAPLAYLWHDGSTESYYSETDEGLVWVRVTGTDECFDYDSAVLIVHPLPVVSLGKDTSLCGNQELELNAGSFNLYEWSTGSIMGTITVGPTGKLADTIYVQVTDENECTSGDTIVIIQCDADKFFADIANTITPNNDGENDVWVIDYIDLFPDAVVEIFDRWGRLIYHKANLDPENVWDGKSQSGKEMPMDSYYYVIDLKYFNVEPLVGTINIIK